MRASTWGALASLATTLLLCESAHAQALAAPTIGSSESSPVTQDAAAVYWNPANLAFFDSPALLLAGQLILGDASYTRDRRATYQNSDSLGFKLPISPGSVDSSKTGNAATSRATPFAPSAAGFGALPLGKGFVAGFGVYAPYAALLHWDDDGAQKWALQQATIIALNVTPSISYRVSDQFAMGAGVSYVLGFLELKKVQDFAAVSDVGQALARPPISQANDFSANAPPGVRELDVMARPIEIQKAIAQGFSFNVGAAWKPTDSLRFGLTYTHSTPLKFNGKFTLDMNDEFFTHDLASQGLQYKPRVTGDATVSFTLPRSILFGASYELTKSFGLVLSLGYTTWSQVDSFDVLARSPDLAQPKLGIPDTAHIVLPRRWKDTIAVDVMPKLKINDSWRMWAVLGYRSSAAPDSTIDAASPDGDRLVAALGAGLAVSQKISLLADFKVQKILPRTVVSSDYDLGNGVYNLTLFVLGGYIQAKLLL